MAREMVVDIVHPVAGATKAIGLPIKFSDTPGRIGRPAPVLGEHTEAVLTEVGYGTGEIAALLSSGAAMSDSGRWS
jgi:crotonobetainyl-CoA:carnitine CoA-transferase CaiB-like acyl-CoA transferase